jgi:S-DNA-T family DNA segregation ATPase FtsK/SpoIIIE
VKAVAGDYIETFLLVNHLHELMHRDLAIFKEKGIRNIVDSAIKKRRFIIVDEAAQLAAEGFMTRKLKDIPEMEQYMELLPEDMQKNGKLKDLLNLCQWYFSEIARLGGGLGYRLIYCTQYPTADTLPRQIKMNSDAKVTFRLPTGYASEVAIDVRGAEKLPSHIKGRALYKTHDLQQMQAPLLTDAEMWGRLQKYQEPVVRKGEVRHVKSVPKEKEPAGGHSEHPGPIEVRDTGAATNHPRVRF